MSIKAISDKDHGGPKYRRIYSELREGISKSAYGKGQKLPSENELVDRFQASRPTVGRALAQLESEGFIERRAGSGTYVVDRNGGGGKSHTFGLLIPALGITEIFEPICQGISHARAGSHHELLWGPLFEPDAPEEVQAERLCEYYLQRNLSGIFFAPLELSEGKDEVNLRIVRAFDEARIPIVLLDRDICEYPDRSKYDIVGIDNRRAGFVITEHLLDCGAQRIVFFSRLNSAPTVGQRILGYREALCTRGTPSMKAAIEYGDPSDIPGIQTMLSRCRPDAIICANDYTAARLMTTLNGIGVRVPSEIMIAGMDDIKYASLLQVPLTTIHQPCNDLGLTALMAMLNRVAYPGGPAHDFLVDFRLTIRQSTGRGSQGLLSADQKQHERE